MTKKWIFFILLLPNLVKAQFQLKIKVKNAIDSVAYFRSTIFDEKNFIPKDTFDLRKKSILYNNTKSIVGGIYFLYFPKSKQKLSFILEDNDTTSIEIDGPDYLNNSKINKNKNQILFNYQRLETELAHFDSSYTVELKLGKKFTQLQKAAYFKIKTDSLVAFRTIALKSLKPKEALFIYFQALNALDASIPNKRDFKARNTFLKQFNLNEPNLLFTPIMRQILVEYASYFPLVADSLTNSLDSVLSRIPCTNKAYPFIFDYFSKLFKSRDISQNTEGYAYLIQKYVKEGNCSFLDPKVKASYITELSQLQFQKISDTCVNIVLSDTSDNKQNLHLFAQQYNYTAVIFYDPNCDHCKVEVPRMDSIINILEQQLLVKIGKFAICNVPNSSKLDWVGFVNKYHLSKNYAHVVLEKDVNIRKAYDAFTNPLFYLIDKDGLLLAKKISTNTLRKELVAAFQQFK